MTKTMSLTAFEATIVSLKIDLYTRKKDWDDFELAVYAAEQKEPRDCWIVNKWQSGGQSGGSCWGAEHHSVEGESEPDFIALDDLLAVVIPDISYLEYKKLMRTVNVVEKIQRDSGDYYGNYDEYTYKAIHVTDLYNAIQGIIEKRC